MIVGVASLVISLVALIVSAIALWFTYVTSAYFTWNEAYCYEVKGAKACYPVRSLCMRSLDQWDRSLWIKECYKVDDVSKSAPAK
jgi:hypothetical protein